MTDFSSLYAYDWIDAITNDTFFITLDLWFPPHISHSSTTLFHLGLYIYTDQWQYFHHSRSMVIQLYLPMTVFSSLCAWKSRSCCLSDITSLSRDVCWASRARDCTVATSAMSFSLLTSLRILASCLSSSVILALSASLTALVTLSEYRKRKSNHKSSRENTFITLLAIAVSEIIVITYHVTIQTLRLRSRLIPSFGPISNQ